MLGVDLITEEIKESKNFQILSKVFSYHYVNKDNLKPIISYDEFKEVLTNFIEEIMKNYLIKMGFADYRGKEPEVKTVDFKDNTSGDYHYNMIRLDETIPCNIFKGNIFAFFTPCHELIHFKYNTDLHAEIINKNTVRVAKETLIRHDAETAAPIFKYDYYSDNYKFDSEEKLADIEGVELFRKIIEYMNITLTREDEIKLLNIYTNNRIQYHNYLRDFRSNIRFNNFFMDFEEAFDFLIRDNPEWCSCPQLQIEYYQDGEGKVRKRTSEELQSILEREDDKDIKEYIQSLLVPNEDKRLYDGGFKQKKLNLKMPYNKYYKISNINNKKYCQE